MRWAESCALNPDVLEKFFKHIPPGQNLSYTEEEHDQMLAHIASVQWFKAANKTSRPKLTAAATDVITGAPVVRSTSTTDTGGNFWCCHNLLRGKFALAPHPLRAGDLMLISWRSDYLDDQG